MPFLDVEANSFFQKCVQDWSKALALGVSSIRLQTHFRIGAGITRTPRTAPTDVPVATEFQWAGVNTQMWAGRDWIVNA